MNNILKKIRRRIVNATKTNDVQIGSVAFMWVLTSFGLATREHPNIPVWYCLAVGSIWAIAAFILNLIDPINPDNDEL